MCDPMTIISVLASGAGGAINAGIQNKAIGEQNRQNQIAMDGERTARIAEENRQLQMERLQSADVTRALATANPTEIAQTTQAAANDPTNQIVKSADVYNTPFLAGQMQNTDIGRAIGETVANGMRRTKDMLKAQALLSGQATGLQGVQDAITRMGSEIQTVGSNRRASGNVARLETTIPAASVAPGNSILGDLLMLGGSAAAGFSGQTAGFANKARIGDLFRPGFKNTFNYVS